MRANLLRNACAVRSVGDMETETITPIGTPYAAALAAFDAAQAALAATPTDELLRKAYALTHRIDVCRRNHQPHQRDGVERDLRAQCDMIDAEILRRAAR